MTGKIPHPELEALRKHIDRIDDQLVQLLAERTAIVDMIGRYKKTHGIDPLDASRWKEVLKSRMDRAANLALDADIVERLYELIHEHSLRIESASPPDMSQERVIFGIQGGEGSFNEEAVQHYVSENHLTNYEVRYLFTSERVMQALVAGEIDFGQCALYNSAGGFVEETTEALEKFPVKVERKFAIKIAHAMMIRADQDFSKIDTIMCHPQVFAQCRRTLAEKYPLFAQVSGEGELVDNAKTAEALSLGQLPPNVVVMGSRVLADIYDLVIVDDNLQDLRENYTEFLLATRV